MSNKYWRVRAIKPWLKDLPRSYQFNDDYYFHTQGTAMAFVQMKRSEGDFVTIQGEVILGKYEEIRLSLEG